MSSRRTSGNCLRLYSYYKVSLKLCWVSFFPLYVVYTDSNEANYLEATGPFPKNFACKELSEESSSSKSFGGRWRKVGGKGLAPSATFR